MLLPFARYVHIRPKNKIPTHVPNFVFPFTCSINLLAASRRFDLNSIPEAFRAFSHWPRVRLPSDDGRGNPNRCQGHQSLTTHASWCYLPQTLLLWGTLV
ncbi:hypothetical protein K461DRAFT_116177 [Myriangium duriaei CBS 260.36]|uniref:Uncharacterized protein n=1 Tax=Myriangium duriaei CBS 260.36 TaxID=1168546 RepID=A0A9P4J479_9PEZI|nr:hypothetical protein K461DRAFT_116177 [Myriangium duriaei CBS 260.36]